MPTTTPILQSTGGYAILEDERWGKVNEAFLSGQINPHTHSTYASGIDAFIRFASEPGLDGIC